MKLQSRLVRLLRPLAEHMGYIESELPFRALPEYELRTADIAFVSKQRWDAGADDDDLRGAPELVIEVLSQSNQPSDLREFAALCLSAGRNSGSSIPAIKPSPSSRRTARASSTQLPPESRSRSSAANSCSPKSSLPLNPHKQIAITKTPSPRVIL